MPDSVKTIDKSKLPSRHVSVGPEKAPHRSYYYAMGMTEEEIAQPLVGVCQPGTRRRPVTFHWHVRRKLPNAGCVIMLARQENSPPSL